MELSNFADSAVKALSEAQNTARSFGHCFVGSEHLLMGIIKCGDRTSSLLNESGVTAELAEPYINTVVGRGRNVFTDSFGNTQTVKRILELSLYEAKSAGKSVIGTEHILLSIMRERDSLGRRIIEELCDNAERLRKALIEDADGFEAGFEPIELQDTDEDENEDYSSEVFPDRKAPSRTPVLNNYSRDLTALARAGKLDPVIGREQETARVLQTLCRKTKNNPVLIGEPGVGKSAVAEGIAQKIIEGSVPPELSDARLLSIDLSAMIAGTKYRGEFEERLKTAIDEAGKDSKIILFVDEIHTIIGAGAGEGSVDAANILKPALARGEVRVIGATTVEEYRKHIEKDPALERRFTPVFVEEPSPEQARRILCGLKSSYERHHGVVISDDAVDSAVDLSVRFMPDRRLPDKAIDLMDEACARVRIAASSEQEKVDRSVEKAAEKGDFVLAERLRAEIRIPGRNTKLSVGSNDVLSVIAEMAGVDPEMLTDKSRFVGIEDRLNGIVFGQESAVNKVSAALRKAAVGFSDPNKPFIIMIFVGPSGCGKGKLAKALADCLFGGSLFKVSGIEYSDDLSCIRLIGSSSAYNENEKTGLLTEFVKKEPFSVICLTDAERASGTVVSLFGELIEKGVTEDGRGRTVSFRNNAVVFCVNTDGSRRSVGFGAADPEEDKLGSLLKRLPEHIVKMADSVVFFDELDRDTIRKIVIGSFEELAARAADKGISVTFTDSAADRITDLTCGSASDIDKLVSVYAEDALSKLILKGGAVRGDRVEIDCINGEFTAERK